MERQLHLLLAFAFAGAVCPEIDGMPQPLQISALLQKYVHFYVRFSLIFLPLPLMTENGCRAKREYWIRRETMARKSTITVMQQGIGYATVAAFLQRFL